MASKLITEKSDYRRVYVFALSSIAALTLAQFILSAADAHPARLAAAALITGMILLSLAVLGRFVFYPIEAARHQQRAELNDKRAQLAQAQAALRAEQVTYRALFDQNHDAVFFLGIDGAYLAFNGNGCEMLGYSREELLGMNFRDVIAPEEVDHGDNILKTLNHGGHVPRYERTFVRKDGTHIVAEINVSLVKTPEGKPIHVQSVVRDLTDRKRAEKQAIELTLEREKLKLLGEFGRLTSRDLRTPLSVINLNLHFLARLDDATERKARVQRLEGEVTKLGMIIDELQILSRLDSGAPLKLKRINMNDLVRSVSQRYRFRTEERGHTLKVELDDSAPLDVEGDSEFLAYTITNLVENVLFDTPENTTIVMSTQRNGAWAWLEARNNQTAAVSTMTCIFEQFIRTSHAVANHNGSHSEGVPSNDATGRDSVVSESRIGLGLALVTKIIALHNGHIEAENIPNEGCVVRMRLPLAAAPVTRSTG